jgi:hypothetical protein
MRFHRPAFGLLTLVVVIVSLVGAWLLPPINALEHQTAPQLIKGTEAKAFAQQLRLRNPRYVDAQKRSAERLSAQGFKQTDTYVVIRLRKQTKGTLLGQLWSFLDRPLHAQAFYGDEGYLIVNSWDDGYAWTWEGNMYLVDYVEPYETSVDSQLDVNSDSEPPPVRWAEGTGYALLDGGVKVYDIKTEDAKGIAVPSFSKASAGGGWTECDNLACNSGRLARCWVDVTLRDSWPWFAMSAGLCRLSGPLYFNCVGLSAGMRFGTGVIQEARAYYRRCMTQ